MSTTQFKALVVTESNANHFSRKFVNKDVSTLPAGDVLINVKYSS